MLTLKIVTEIIKNHSEFSGCQNSCNEYKSILINHEITCDTVMKKNLCPIAPLLKGQRGNAPATPPFSRGPVHISLHALSFLVVGYNVSL